MIKARPQKRIGGGFDEQPPKDFYFAVGFAALAALLHTYALVIEAFEATEAEVLTSHTILWVLVGVELCLLINVAGLLLRKARGMLVSAIALTGVGLGYAVWYLYSRQVLELLLSKAFYRLHPEALPPHALSLLGATWANLVVLAMSAILFIWELKTLRGRRRA